MFITSPRLLRQYQSRRLRHMPLFTAFFIRHSDVIHAETTPRQNSRLLVRLNQPATLDFFPPRSRHFAQREFIRPTDQR
jgi:hypothetical protein